MLTPAEQARVFEAPPAGHRKVVATTNVAETSITVYVQGGGGVPRTCVPRRGTFSDLAGC